MYFHIHRSKVTMNKIQNLDFVAMGTVLQFVFIGASKEAFLKKLFTLTLRCFGKYKVESCRENWMPAIYGLADTKISPKFVSKY